MELDVVLARLASPEWAERIDAVRALGAFDDALAHEALERVLFDLDGLAVAAAAAETMALSDDRRFVEPLARALQSMDDETSEEISSVLHELAADSAVAAEALRAGAG